MPRKPQPPRELAARALCRHDGHPENAKFEGKPMWESYLPAADAVLEAIGWGDAPMIPVYRMSQLKSDKP